MRIVVCVLVWIALLGLSQSSHLNAAHRKVSRVARMGTTLGMELQAEAYAQAEVDAGSLLSVFESCVASCSDAPCAHKCANGGPNAPSNNNNNNNNNNSDNGGDDANPEQPDNGITIVNNVNTLNDGLPVKKGHGDGHGDNDNNDHGNGENPNGTPKKKCSEFWQAKGCTRPKVPNPAKQEATCEDDEDKCTLACCQDPINYGNCGNFFQQKGCPKDWEPKNSDSQGVACDFEEVCRGKCCKPRPYTCEKFWEIKKCDPRTHEVKQDAGNLQCDPMSTHCVKTCCNPKTIDCPTYFDIYKRCPPVFRPHNRNAQCTPGFEWSNAKACFKQCCDGIPAGNGRCGSWGDPHMITWDNAHYDCQANGEYVLYKNDQWNEEIHNQQAKPPGAPAHAPGYNTGVAFRAGTELLTIELVPPAWETFQVNVRFNKKLVPYPDHVTKYGVFVLFPVGTLPAADARAWPSPLGLNVMNTKTGTGVAIWWNPGGLRAYGNIDITIPNVEEKGRMQSVGLCGTWNGNPKDDHVGAQGQVCSGHTSPCCTSWMVAREQSYFAHAPAQGTPPKEEGGIGSVCVTSAKLKEAQGKCSSAIGGLQEECITDFCAGDTNVKHLMSEIAQAVKGK